ncbi:MAG: amino acid-binding protein [Oscillospiraceae bacterium]|nr:amino acid-binding protein [Oscillospiraceae bacterium]
MKQLTVFIENRMGRLEEVTEILSANNINIICISLADTSEYGMLRMIVSQPAAACEVLSASGFSAMLSDIIAVKLPHHFGTLKKLSGILSESSIDIRYMYALTSGSDAAIVIKTSDNEKAEGIISAEFEILNAVDVYNM